MFTRYNGTASRIRNLSEFAYKTPTQLTIATGEITVTQSFHTIEGEGAAADDLDTINGMTDYGMYWFKPANASHNITVKHGTGNVLTPSGLDYTIPDDAFIMIYYDGSNALMLGAAVGGAGGVGDVVGPGLATDNALVVFDGATGKLIKEASTDIGVSQNLITTDYIGRDSDNYLGWGTDDQLDIRIGGVTIAIVSISTGTGDNDKLATQGYVDDAVSVENLWDRVTGTPNYVLPHTAADDIGATAARITKGWFTDIESTNMPTVGSASLSTLFAGIVGNTRTVGISGCQYTTITAAMSAASSGDTILVYPGTYTETVTFTNNNITIRAMGTAQNVIITQADAQVIDVNTRTNCSIVGCKITMTAPTAGKALITCSTGTLTVKNCYMSVTCSASFSAAYQPVILETTGAGTIITKFGEFYYSHTGTSGSGGRKIIAQLVNGSTITILRPCNITMITSGQSLTTGLVFNLSTGVYYVRNAVNITINAVDTNSISGFGYITGSGDAEFIGNNLHITGGATNNSYGLFNNGTGTVRSFFNHIHVTSSGGAVYGFNTGATARTESTCDSVIAASGNVTAGVLVLASSLSAGAFTTTGLLTAGGLALGTNSITMTGSLATTGSRVTKGWFTDLEVTNAIAGSITGNAATVSTIAGLAPNTATTAAAQPNITSLGTLTSLTTGAITTTSTIGRDADNVIGWGVDDSLAITIGGVAHAIASISTGVADNDKLVTQGYVDDAVTGAGGGTVQGTYYTYDIQATASSGAANARGENSVDLQTIRAAATQVASGTGSVIAGGVNNTCAGLRSVTVGGYSNNLGVADYAFIGGGSGNSILTGGTYAVVCGGTANEIQATGGYGFIGAGDNNIVNANAAIVCGSSCSISIAGTASFTGGGSNHTITAANSAIVGGVNHDISATYCFVGGGDNNDISAAYGTIAGGEDGSITAAHGFIGGGYSHSITATYSGIASGYNNTVAGTYSCVAGGYGNNIYATASSAFIGGGDYNSVYSLKGSVLCGDHCTVSSTGVNGIATGYYTTSYLYGHRAASSGCRSLSGDAQTGYIDWRGSTTDDSETELFLNGTSLKAILPASRAWAFMITIVGVKSDYSDMVHVEQRGCIVRDGSNNTSIIGTVLTTVIENTAGATFAVTADDATEYLKVTVTHEATWYWHAYGRLVEVG